MISIGETGEWLRWCKEMFIIEFLLLFLNLYKTEKVSSEFNLNLQFIPVMLNSSFC